MKLLQSVVLTLLLVATGAGAQASFELAGGLGSMTANWPISTGGTWTAVSGTAMFNPHFGFNADLNTRVIGKSFGDRPYLADVNLVLRAPPARVTPELELGWGGASIPTGGSCLAFDIVPCSTAGSQFSNGVHIGISAMVYTAGRMFLRPVYHLYVGNNMGHPNYFGVMIGYTFGKH